MFDGPDSDPLPYFKSDLHTDIEEKLQKQVKSDLFVIIFHMKKIMQEDGSTIVVCNCYKMYLSGTNLEDMAHIRSI